MKIWDLEREHDKLLASIVEGREKKKQDIGAAVVVGDVIPLASAAAHDAAVGEGDAGVGQLGKGGGVQAGGGAHVQGADRGDDIADAACGRRGGRGGAA